MAVVALPTRSSAQWSAAADALAGALATADHPRMTEHGQVAGRILAEAGRPTRVWANRVAAISVIAGRRADTAPTISRRAAYFDVAAASTALLVLAEAVHGVRPHEDALAVLAEQRLVDRAALV